MTVLEGRGITKRFGGRVAVEDVSIAVPAGAVAALIGPNGAGKTTLFSCLTGATAVDAGSVLLDGADVTLLGADARARLGVGRTFQRLSVFGSMTVSNLLVGAGRPGGRRCGVACSGCRTAGRTATRRRSRRCCRCSASRNEYSGRSRRARGRLGRSASLYDDRLREGRDFDRRRRATSLSGGSVQRSSGDRHRAAGRSNGNPHHRSGWW